MASENFAHERTPTSLEQALSPDLPEKDLVTLARSDALEVRAVVAERVDMPLMTLVALARDRAAEVRAGVASNRRTDIPEDLYLELAADKSVDVVFALIYNPVVPTSIIAKLARQFHKRHASAARARLASGGVSAGLSAP